MKRIAIVFIGSMALLGACKSSSGVSSNEAVQEKSTVTTREKTESSAVKPKVDLSPNYDIRHKSQQEKVNDPK